MDVLAHLYIAFRTSSIGSVLSVITAINFYLKKEMLLVSAFVYSSAMGMLILLPAAFNILFTYLLPLRGLPVL